LGAKIVLADDEPDLRAIYATILRREGYEVWEASEGAEALDMVAREQPDLLLLDVRMPALNGFEVLDRLRFDPGASLTKVVMLSNLDDADVRLEGFSGGVADYWVKGLSLDEFCDKVRRLLAASAADAC
jgi:DNA-binding response OmpR family regulator